MEITLVAMDPTRFITTITTIHPGDSTIRSLDGDTILGTQPIGPGFGLQLQWLFLLRCGVDYLSAAQDLVLSLLRFIQDQFFG